MPRHRERVKSLSQIMAENASAISLQKTPARTPPASPDQGTRTRRTARMRHIKFWDSHQPSPVLLLPEQTDVNEPIPSLQMHLERMKLELEKVIGSTRADRLDWLLGKHKPP